MSEQTIVLKIQINGSDVSVTGSPEKVKDSPVAVEAKPVQVKKPKTVKKTEQKSEHVPFTIPTTASPYKTVASSNFEELANKPHVPFYINVNTPKSPEEIEGERMMDANRGHRYEPPANESDETFFIYSMIITAVVVGLIVLSEYPPVKDLFNCLAHKGHLGFIAFIMGFVVPCFLFYLGVKKYRDSAIPFVIWMIDIFILSCILANQ